MSVSILMQPHLESAGLAIFDQYVSGTWCYMEYGSGGSTLRAKSIKAKNIISIDSSYEWVSAVEAATNFSPHVDVIYCNIGKVGKWGRPEDESGMLNYHSYITKPWDMARRKHLNPTVIFIDGRFRVACFLYSLICARLGTVILFDDYTNRKQYHIVEDFCKPKDTFGRMAVFEATNSYNLPILVAKIAEYSVNFQ